MSISCQFGLFQVFFTDTHIPVFIPFSLKSACICTLPGKSSKWFLKWSQWFSKIIGMFQANHRDEIEKWSRWFCRTNWNKGKKEGKKASKRPLKAVLTPRSLCYKDLLWLTFWLESILFTNASIYSSTLFRFSGDKKQLSGSLVNKMTIANTLSFLYL